MRLSLGTLVRSFRATDRICAVTPPLSIQSTDCAGFKGLEKHGIQNPNNEPLLSLEVHLDVNAENKRTKDNSATDSRYILMESYGKSGEGFVFGTGRADHSARSLGDPDFNDRLAHAKLYSQWRREIVEIHDTSSDSTSTNSVVIFKINNSAPFDSRGNEYAPFHAKVNLLSHADDIASQLERMGFEKPPVYNNPNTIMFRGWKFDRIIDHHRENLYPGASNDGIMTKFLDKITPNVG